ncbi:MAG: response regulator [Acidobacteria bacterium]|nr:MAG: response regulator [Acidobacteriota bacterium]
MSHETSGALEEAVSHTLAASAAHEDIESGKQERSKDAVSVMVVDDEPGVRGFVAKVLTRHGYACYEACNAGEAIARATTSPPSLTITDIRMPGGDGSWLLGQLKERCPEMAVIMLTAVPEAKTAVECLKAGADDYLVKPIDMEALVRATDRALEKRLYRQLLARKDVSAVRLWVRTEGELRLAVDEGSFSTDGREAAESAISDARTHVLPSEIGVLVSVPVNVRGDPRGVLQVGWNDDAETHASESERFASLVAAAMAREKQNKIPESWLSSPQLDH